MAWRKEGDKVVVEISEAEFEALLYEIGVTARMAMQQKQARLFWSCLAFANRLNEGNPDWRPYEIPPDIQTFGDYTETLASLAMGERREMIQLAKLAVAYRQAHGVFFPAPANEMAQLGKGLLLRMGIRYWISPRGDSITCVQCGLTSNQPQDVIRRYCGGCHQFLAEDVPEDSARGPEIVRKGAES